jgi:Integrase zinc binding domain/Integrase core domain
VTAKVFATRRAAKMDNEHYKHIYQYLSFQQLPDSFNTQQKQQLRKQSDNYIIKNELLYKKDKNYQTKLYRVIQQEELPAVLYMMHNDPTSGHFATDATFAKIKTRYYWPQYYNDVKKYVKSCDSCQRRGRSKKNNILHPIPVHSPFYQIGIDFVGPLPRTRRGKKYIIVAMDYLTKWPEARAVSEATAESAANFIYEQIICQHGCLQILLSDRGTHFNNNMIQKLTEKFKINHLLSTPYHPQTNGLVERFNRTLCESLARLSLKNNDWDLYIAPTLFAYRTTKHSTTKIEPFFMVYGRAARLPIDTTESESHVAEKDHLVDLIDQLPQIRAEAKLQITQSQSKQKDRHDRKLKKSHQFETGDQVLYFNVTLDQSHSGKFNPKWKGPFVIHQILPHGSYKLITIDGQILSTPINGNLLKLYHTPIFNYK